MNPVVKSSSPGPTSTLRARRHAGAPEPSRRDSRDPGSAACISSRSSCRTTLRETHFPLEKVKRCFHRNQQYSINAVTNGGGTVVERYAYSAYGTPTMTGGSGSIITTSAISNRYAYTGREWNGVLALYHYRARMYDPVSGRFVSRDPIGFFSGSFSVVTYINSSPLMDVDPLGLTAGVLAPPVRHSVPISTMPGYPTNHSPNRPGTKPNSTPVFLYYPLPPNWHPLVPTPHQSFRAERFWHVCKPRKQPVSSPLVFAGVDGNTGDFTSHIAALGQCLGLFFPEVR